MAVIRSAAEAGNIRAQKQLASLYGYGKGVPRDEQQSLHWNTKAAEAGDGDAQNSVALYYVGKKQWAAARFWAEKATAQKVPSADGLLQMIVVELEKEKK